VSSIAGDDRWTIGSAAAAAAAGAMAERHCCCQPTVSRTCALVSTMPPCVAECTDVDDGLTPGMFTERRSLIAPDLSTDRVSAGGNAIVSVRPSVCVFPLLTFETRESALTADIHGHLSGHDGPL